MFQHLHLHSPICTKHAVGVLSWYRSTTSALFAVTHGSLINATWPRPWYSYVQCTLICAKRSTVATSVPHCMLTQKLFYIQLDPFIIQFSTGCMLLRAPILPFFQFCLEFHKGHFWVHSCFWYLLMMKQVECIHGQLPFTIILLMTWLYSYIYSNHHCNWFPNYPSDVKLLWVRNNFLSFQPSIEMLCYVA